MSMYVCVCYAYIGYRLVGDVDFDDCKEVASKITPVRPIHSIHTQHILLMTYSYTARTYTVYYTTTVYRSLAVWVP